MTTELSNGYTIRAPRREESKALLDLVHAYDIAEYGDPDFEEQDFFDEWDRSGFDLARDAWVVQDEAGGLVGYAILYEDNAQGIEHPAHRGKGILSALVHVMEQRRLEIADEQSQTGPVYLKHWCNGFNETENDFYRANGYQHIRTFWRMQIDLSEPPPAPVWADGVTIRTFREDADIAPLLAVHNRAFSEHFDHENIDEAYLQEQINADWFDSSLWYVVEKNGEMIAALRGRTTMGQGWIRSLCVRPDTRGLGIGLAMLHHAFAEYHKRGFNRIWLAVDSENSTGATRLYERAGMRVARQHHRYSKRLRG